MDVKTKLNYLHIPPRKVRLMASAIRGMDARRAEIMLAHAPKRAALPLLKLLRSALGDAAHNFQAQTQSFYVKEIRVDPGPVAKRFRARAFGRAAPIRKRTSHVVLVLGTRDSSSVVSRPASVKKAAPVLRDALPEDTAYEAARGVRGASAAAGVSKPKTPGAIRKIFQRKVI